MPEPCACARAALKREPSKYVTSRITIRFLLIYYGSSAHAFVGQVPSSRNAEVAIWFQMSCGSVICVRGLELAVCEVEWRAVKKCDRSFAKSTETKRRCIARRDASTSSAS